MCVATYEVMPITSRRAGDSTSVLSQCHVWPGGHTSVEGTRREQSLGRVKSLASRWYVVQSRILDAIPTCTEDSSTMYIRIQCEEISVIRRVASQTV